MDRIKNIPRYWLVPIILIVIALILDAAALLKILTPAAAVRNFILVAVFILLIPFMQELQQNISIYGKVKLIFVAVLSINLLNFLYRGEEPLFNSFQSYFSHFIITWVSVVGTLIAITAIRDLIFVQRKKHTSQQFYLLIAALIIYGFLARHDYSGFNLSLVDSEAAAVTTPKWMTTISMILSIFMVYLIVLNSFRTQWVKVLNKGQKIKTFLMSGAIIFLLIVALFVITDGNGKKLQALHNYSPSVGNLIWACLLFIFVYFFISIIVVMLHLPTASVYDRKVKEISSLHQLSSMILGVFDSDKLAKIILQRTIEITEANYCWLLLKAPSSNQFELVARQNVPQKMLNFLTINTSNDLTDWIIHHQTSLSIEQLTKHKLTAQLDPWSKMPGSLLGIPLSSGNKVVGLLFAVKNAEYGFLPDDKVLLTAFANHATIALDNAHLVQKTLEQEKYKQELKIAHEAQMKLLPRTMPQYQTIDIDASCVTANEVGGDYYDFFEFDKTKFGIVIGDVSGKGPEAAFYMAEVKGVLESLCHIYQSPRDLLIQANQIIYENFDSKTFVSVIYGIFDLKKNRFQFCRAGHCPVVFWNNREQQVHLIEPSGLALGLDSGKFFAKTLTEKKLPLQVGDIFLFYTDGVNEARNHRHEEFEEQRLCEIVVNNHQSTSLELKTEILNQIKQFVGTQASHDDLTMMVIKIREIF